jgi:[ribosomal protein S5]-alanine N-acetyltransferase
LRLHRIEAATLAHNDASIRVLERNGFEREGFARSYLKINGEWRDHILFAMIAEEYQAKSAAREERIVDAHRLDKATS